MDQCPYLSTYTPTPPLTQHYPELVISWLLLGQGRGGVLSCSDTDIDTKVFSTCEKIHVLMFIRI